MPLPIFALTARGLEAITHRELSQFAGVANSGTAYRRVFAHYQGDWAALRNLRTADDVFLQLAEWDALPHTRDALVLIHDAAATLDLAHAFTHLQTIRPMPTQPSFYVTANFVGKRNYTMPEIKAAVTDGIIAQAPHWHSADDDHDAQVNVRVFIEHDRAWVGVRLYEKPLHRRDYKQVHVPGSLKPTVAAAMLELAQLAPGQTVLDAFCGGGTIISEALSVGIRALGGDLDAATLAGAKQNLPMQTSATAVYAFPYYQWDAAHLPVAAASVDAVVANLPWGRQIQVQTAPLYPAALAEMRRVTRAGGRLVLLIGDLSALPINETPLAHYEISLFGQNPSIVVLET